eukprot:scaffold27801_cov219-Skeletonema_marinoi.AAC.3
MVPMIPVSTTTPRSRETVAVLLQVLQLHIAVRSPKLHGLDSFPASLSPSSKCVGKHNPQGMRTMTCVSHLPFPATAFSVVSE